MALDPLALLRDHLQKLPALQEATIYSLLAAGYKFEDMYSTESYARDVWTVYLGKQPEIGEHPTGQRLACITTVYDFDNFTVKYQLEFDDSIKNRVKEVTLGLG